MAVVAGALSLTTARTIVLSQPSGGELLRQYKRQAMHFEQSADSDTVSTYNFGVTHIVERPAHIVERPAHIVDRSAHIVERPAHIVERPAHIVERPAHIVGRPAHIVERPAHIVDRPAHIVDRSAGEQRI